MSTAKDLQKQVEEAKLELEQELIGKVKALLRDVIVEATVQLDFKGIQVRLVEESKSPTAVKVVKTFFERVENENETLRNFGTRNTGILTDRAGMVIGTTSETSVYSYQLISLVFNIIESFHKEHNPVETEEEEVEQVN